MEVYTSSSCVDLSHKLHDRQINSWRLAQYREAGIDPTPFRGSSMTYHGSISTPGFLLVACVGLAASPRWKPSARHQIWDKRQRAMRHEKSYVGCKNSDFRLPEQSALELLVRSLYPHVPVGRSFGVNIFTLTANSPVHVPHFRYHDRSNRNEER